ncbi:MAG: hypothetical protein PHF70_08115 [Opitutales bacterium]|nr:hypothetical protein [Opitutales bacterium]
MSTGSYGSSVRLEYPVFSNKLPNALVSVWRNGSQCMSTAAGKRIRLHLVGSAFHGATEHQSLLDCGQGQTRI